MHWIVIDGCHSLAKEDKVVGVTSSEGFEIHFDSDRLISDVMRMRRCVWNVTLRPKIDDFLTWKMVVQECVTIWNVYEIVSQSRKGCDYRVNADLQGLTLWVVPN